MLDILDKETIKDNLIAQITDKYPTLEVEDGSMVRDIMIDPQSEVASQIYTQINEVNKINAYVENAESISIEDLDRKGQDLGVKRKQEQYATSKISFRATSLPNSEIRIGNEDGTGGIYVSTLNLENGTAIEFVTTETVYFNADTASFNQSSGYYELSANIKATISGTSSNVGIGTILVLKTPINGIAGVYNYVSATGGTDMENNTDYANDMVTAIQGSTNVVAKGIEKITKNVPGVTEVKIFNPNSEEPSPLGIVYDYIKGENLTSTTDTITYYTIYNNYKLQNRPVRSIISVQATVNGHLETLVNGRDYYLLNDTTSEYADSSQADDYIIFTSNALLVPDNSTAVSITYIYNNLVSITQNYVNENERDILLLGEIIVKQATPIIIDLGLTIKLKYGYSTPTYKNEIASAINSYINSKLMGENLLMSDVYTYIIENYKDIIESVYYPFSTFKRRSQTSGSNINTILVAIYGEYFTTDENSIKIEFL